MNLSVQLLSGVLDDNVSPVLTLTLVNGSARSGQDFLYPSSYSILLSFDSSTTQHYIAIGLINDGRVEETENFFAQLSVYLHGENDNITISPSEAVITILDDDGK